MTKRVLCATLRCRYQTRRRLVVDPAFSENIPTLTAGQQFSRHLTNSDRGCNHIHPLSAESQCGGIAMSIRPDSEKKTIICPDCSLEYPAVDMLPHGMWAVGDIKYIDTTHKIILTPTDPDPHPSGVNDTFYMIP